MGDVGYCPDHSPQLHSIPRLETTARGHQLIVDDKPYLMLAGELQNSSLSCPDYMRSVWPKLVEANFNTILGSVTWESIEPRENVFDFSRLDEVILDARSHGLHLILLWFGSFKNGRSTYVPSWVKQNPKRFPRAVLRKAGGRLETTDALSVFHQSATKADAKAFAMLMRHLKCIDEGHSTILMVQVENEVGLLGDSRDACPEANRCFDDPVPYKLLSSLADQWDSLHESFKKNFTVTARTLKASEGLSWEKVFGSSVRTDELFMAYHFASYVNQIAAAGKSEYPIPLFTNVWQNYVDETYDTSVPIVVGGGGQPGDYPSGGGVINVLDIWKLFAPSLDLIAPDVYLNDYNLTCAKYQHLNQPLLIPEQRRDEYGARRIWSAFGTYGALCTAPFGIDTLEPFENPFKRHYELLSQVSQHVLFAQSRPGSSFGFYLDELRSDKSDPSPAMSVRFGSWNLSIERSFVFGKPGPGFGMIIHLGEARFLLIGEGFQVRFSSSDPAVYFTGILSFVEKVVADPETGHMKDGRILNGDETRSGEQCIMPGETPDYGDFPISVTIPARTRVAECEVYCLTNNEG